MSASLIKKADKKLEKYHELVTAAMNKEKEWVQMPDEYYIEYAPTMYLLTLDDVHKISNKKLKELVVVEPQDYSFASILNIKSEAIVNEYFYGNDAPHGVELAVTSGSGNVWMVVTPEFLNWLDVLNTKLEKVVMSSDPVPKKKNTVYYKVVKTIVPTLNADISITELKKEIKANLKIHAKAFEAVTKMVDESDIPKEFFVSSIPHSYALKMTDVEKIRSGKVREFIVIEPPDYDYISVLNKCSEAIIDNNFHIGNLDVVTTDGNVWILVTPKFLLWLEKLIVNMEKWIIAS